MADDEAARRREIRRRKILEGSEARLKRITSTISSKSTGEHVLEEHNEKQTKANQNFEIDQYHSSEHDINDSLTNADDDFSSEQLSHLNHESFETFNEQFFVDDLSTVNGNFSRAGSSENYTFPKKVSDAESRSFRRTRGDARRNSTCTQMMMETFQFSTLSLNLLRPWIICLGAFILRIYLLITHVLPCCETIYLPLIMLELAFLAWSQLESQMFSKPVEGSLISGILLLCGIKERLISRIIAVWNFVNCIVLDFAIFTFLFVFTHYVCEVSM
ncbi:uncharacterized protein [Parasteatoda tepidariorum]|nr:uncharacterized protein LOC107443436 [Parasteatoda tepidariorum]